MSTPLEPLCPDCAASIGHDDDCPVPLRGCRVALAAAEAQLVEMRAMVETAIPYFDTNHASDEAACDACMRTKAARALLAQPHSTEALRAMLLTAVRKAWEAHASAEPEAVVNAVLGRTP